MDFTNLFTNQSEVVKMINKSFNNNRLSQVYLFHGEKGTLKMDAALYFASLVLCEAGGNCGMCSQCKKIERLINPNIFNIFLLVSVEKNSKHENSNEKKKCF